MFERFTKEARVAVVLAQEEARDTHASQITPSHLLLGVLDNLSTTGITTLAEVGVTRELIRGAAERVLSERDERALRSIGIDLDAVASAVEQRFSFDVRRRIRKGTMSGSHIPFSPTAKKSLELALREALARKDNEIAAEHLVLGILRSDDPDLLATIKSVTTIDDVRSLVHRLLDQPAA